MSVVRRVVAPNPGPYAGPGTNTWLIDAGSVAVVIDPGPEDDAHLAAIDRALKGTTVAVVLVTHSHPDHLPLAERVASMDLWLLAIGATVYAAVRIAEGYGLWLDREWAEWLGAVSGLIYVPFELYALAKGVTPLKLATLGINLLVVAVLSDALWRRRR